MSGIVVAVDGSPAAADAVALAAQLADALGTTATVACVHPPRALSAHVGGRAFEDRDADAAQRIVDAVAWPADASPPQRRVACAATAALGLRMMAREQQADLIVVGSSHRHGLGRAVPGTTAMRLLAAQAWPVAIAAAGSAGTPTGAPRRIGVAYDGSSPARRALAFAARLAERTRASLTVIDVATPRTPLELARYGPAAAPLIGLEPARAEARDHLAEALTQIPADVTVEAELLQGDPATRLADVSDDLDLMIMGSHAHGVLGRLVLGSTSDAVAAEVRCPLVIVPG